MTKNEIVGRLKAGGLDASSTNRSAEVYVADAMAGRAVPGWFAYRIVCDSEATERRARAILSRWYDIDVNGNVWRLRSKNRVPLMAIKRGGVPPAPPTPTGDYMYFEAVQDGSTVSMTSTLETAPNFEYSTDGMTWQEWQHTTSDGTHTFDNITLTAIGDRVYLRGENNDISDIANNKMTMFVGSGKMNSGGNITSLFNKTGEDSEIGGAAALFANMGTSDFLLSAPALNMTGFTNIGSLMMLFYGQTSLTTSAYMPNITFEDVFPETTGIYADSTQMFGMYANTKVRLVSEDYNSIPSMPSFVLGNSISFYTDSTPSYIPTIMNAENVALCLSANINTVYVQGRESVYGGYYFIDGGLNAGTRSSVSIRDGRTVTFVAVPQSGYHIVKWIKAEPLWSGTADTDIPDSAILTLSYNLPVKEGDTLYEAAIEPVFEQD